MLKLKRQYQLKIRIKGTKSFEVDFYKNTGGKGTKYTNLTDSNLKDGSEIFFLA